MNEIPKIYLKQEMVMVTFLSALNQKEHLNVLENSIKFETHFECNCLKRNTWIRLYIYSTNAIKYIVYNTTTLNTEIRNSFSKILYFLNGII